MSNCACWRLLIPVPHDVGVFLHGCALHPYASKYLAFFCFALCAHHNREGKHDKQAKPWEPSHSGPAPHSLDLVSTKEHGDVPEAIRKLEANDDDAV